MCGLRSSNTCCQGTGERTTRDAYVRNVKQLTSICDCILPATSNPFPSHIEKERMTIKMHLVRTTYIPSYQTQYRSCKHACHGWCQAINVASVASCGNIIGFQGLLCRTGTLPTLSKSPTRGLDTLDAYGVLYCTMYSAQYITKDQGCHV
jgi:hypothetical protein